MKTITIDFEEYELELLNRYSAGFRAGCIRMKNVLKAIKQKDYREAHLLLIEDLENEGHILFQELTYSDPEASAWLKKEGLS